MKSSRPEKGKKIGNKTIKNIGNLFRLEKENKAVKNRVIGDMKNLFRLKQENKGIKSRVNRNIRNLLEHEEAGNYYKPVRICNFWSNNYIENERNSDKIKTISVEQYLDRI